MKKTLILIMMFILFISSTTLAADKAKAPEDFRGIKFGTDLSTIKEFRVKGKIGQWGLQALVLDSFDTESRYLYWKKRGEKLAIGNIQCKGIAYHTFNNKLIRGEILFDIDNYDLIMESLVEMYGQHAPKTHPSVIYVDWDLGDVSVSLERCYPRDCLLSFNSKIFSKEQRAYFLRWEKDQKDKAEQEKNKAEQEKKQKIDSFKKDL